MIQQERQIKQTKIGTTFRLVGAVGLALAVVGLVLAGLFVIARPVNAGQSDFYGTRKGYEDGSGLPSVQGLAKFGETHPSPSRLLRNGIYEGLSVDAPAAAPNYQGSLSITKLASADTIVNGQRITYTIIVQNNTGTTHTNVVVSDKLPNDTLDNIYCADCKMKVTDMMTMQDFIYGGVFTVSVVDQITWTVAAMLGPGQSVTRTFSARVTCRSAGEKIVNTAVVKSNEMDQSVGDSAETSVQPPTQQMSGNAIADQANWCSSGLNIQSAFDMDWGDFDGDGDLDLVLGSVGLGVSIYRNKGNGQLEHFRQINRTAYGVRWVDVNNNGQLELVIAGGVSAGQGRNYIYSPPNFSSPMFMCGASYFASPGQLFRIATGDFDGDGDFDLIGSTLAFTGANSGVYLFANTLETSSGPQFCASQNIINDQNAVSLSPADYDNDGDMDLAVGLFDTSIWVLKNNGRGSFLVDPPAPVDVTHNEDEWPYDLTWGDYDQDGDLDLAAVFPALWEVDIYRNDTTSFYKDWSFSTNAPPISIDWADFDGNGRVDLAVGGMGLWVYKNELNSAGYINFSQSFTAAVALGNMQSWRVRGADYDNDSDLDLTMSDYSGPSLIFENFGGLLTSVLTPVDNLKSASVAWGDAGSDTEGYSIPDGYLDLLFGEGKDAGSDGSTLYIFASTSPTFRKWETSNISTGSPQAAAFGYMNNDDRDLDRVFCSLIGGQSHLAVYLNGNNTSNPDWASEAAETSPPCWSVAVADANDDGMSDLLTGNNGASIFYLNGVDQDGEMFFTPVWSSTERFDTRSVAWWDYNQDFYPDFAAANYNGPAQVYINNKNNTFSQVWQSTEILSGTAVAWGDYDLDGDADLAVGTKGQGIYLYENNGSGFTPHVIPDTNYNVSGVAWGDWNNDGDLDLAVAVHDDVIGGARVYDNDGSAPGSPQLFLRWKSSPDTPYSATGVAWGDYDRDGDLDLAMSQDGNSANGFFENTYILAQHSHYSDFGRFMPLVNNPTYLSLGRPCNYTTPTSYSYSPIVPCSWSEISSPEILASPAITQVFVPFMLFDPDGVTRTNIIPWQINSYSGDDIIHLTGASFEFSLDGGSTWRQASASGSSRVDYIHPYPQPSWDGQEETTLRGRKYFFRWDALKDDAVSNDARFRVTIAPHIGSMTPTHQTMIPGSNPPTSSYTTTVPAIPINRAGLPQRGEYMAVSPPFRIRAMTCVWPQQAIITVTSPSPYKPNTLIDFVGGISPWPAASALIYNWDFGDGSEPVNGKIPRHAYAYVGSYRITMTAWIREDYCPPASRKVVANATIQVGALYTNSVYLPLVLKPTGSVASVAGPVGPTPTPKLSIPPAPPGSPMQVVGLVGHSKAGVSSLTWQPNPAGDEVLEYRIYRAGADSVFERLATTPGNTTAYTDQTDSCGHVYYITAYNTKGESLCSLDSYYSLPCP